MSSSYLIANLLEKMTNPDADFRFMATQDLITELKQSKLEDSTERKVVAAVVKLLQDTNGEVQNIAIKSYHPYNYRLPSLLASVRPQNASTLMTEIAALLNKKADTLKDVAAMALKSLISAATPNSASATALVSLLAPKFLPSLSGPNIHLEIVDLLSQLFTISDVYWADVNTSLALQKSSLTVLMPLLDHSRAVVRKRAIVAIGNLAVIAFSDIKVTLVNALLKALKEQESQNDHQKIITLVSVISTLCRQNIKLDQFMDTVCKATIQFIKLDDDDLKETCISALEVYCSHPESVAHYIPQIIQVATEYLQYDPNCNEDVDMDLEDDEESEDDFSDNDDMSWYNPLTTGKYVEPLQSFFRP
jgi:hypothetical protein